MIEQLREATDEQCEQIKAQIIAIAGEYGPSNTISLLESKKYEERLPVQWELDEVIEALEPTKKKGKKDNEDEDDPSNRRLRSSELELYYNDPHRGIRLFKSKVDERWVLMQMDPRTGGMLQNELQAKDAHPIIQQLQMMGAPFWIKQPPMPNQPG